MKIKKLAAACTLIASTTTALAGSSEYHAHLNYLQFSGNYVTTDSHLDISGGSVEFQGQMTSNWIARLGYMYGEDSGDDIQLDQMYGSIGYILGNDGNTAHILELGLNRSEVDVSTGNRISNLDSDAYGVGYRYWWHMGRRWEAELDLNAWQAFNSDEGEDDFEFTGQIRLNYYFADKWGTGFQYKYNEDTDTFGIYIRYVF